MDGKRRERLTQWTTFSIFPEQYFEEKNIFPRKDCEENREYVSKTKQIFYEIIANKREREKEIYR